MEPCRIMLLNDKPEPVGRPDLNLSGWFSGFLEIALGLIGRNLAGHHRSPASTVVFDRLHIRFHHKSVDKRPYRLFLSQVIDYGDRIGCNRFQDFTPGSRLGRIEKGFTRLPLGF